MVIKREIIGGLVIFDAKTERFYTSLSINLPPGHLEDQERLELGMSQQIQNMSNRIFKHWFSKDEYHFGDWKLNRNTENEEGILCPTGIANITLPCNNYCNNLNCTLGYTVNNYKESYLCHVQVKSWCPGISHYFFWMDCDKLKWEPDDKRKCEGDHGTNFFDFC